MQIDIYRIYAHIYANIYANTYTLHNMYTVFTRKNAYARKSASLELALIFKGGAHLGIT